MKNLLLGAVLLHVASAAFDGTVCQQPASSGAKARPAVANVFEVHIMCTIINKNLTTEVHEFYNKQLNKGEVRQTEMGVSYYGYFDYNNNEFLGIYPQEGTCQVSDLATSDQRFLFGYNTSTPGHGGSIYSAAGALHFSGEGIVEQYAGSDNVRGITVEKWYSCQYWKGMDATMNVTWYFSDPMEWDMALSIVSTPIRAWVKGKVGGDNPHAFEHIYDLIFFRNFIETPNAFETPDLVSCPGRVTTKDFPQISPAFSFTVEIINAGNEEVKFMKEWYDQQMNMVRYEYTPTQSSSNGVFGYRPLTEVHDFNTGMAYVTDKQRGNCSWQLIEMYSFDDIKADAFDVRMKSASQFFYMNTTGVTYEGVKVTRNINTDVFVGNRKDFPPQNPLNSTFEWRFLSSFYKRMQTADDLYNDGVPVQMHLAMPQYEVDFIYNVYNFKQAQPNMLNWDISACYYNLNRRKFDFTVPGAYASNISVNQEVFKYGILVTLQMTLKVSPIRISRLKLVFEQDVHVRFELLDVAPMTGDVRKHPAETPLNVAAKLLVSNINSNKLIIPLITTGGTPLSVVATPHSIQEYNYEDELAPAASGYSGGSMGGLAVAMLIVGGGGGGVGAYFFFK